MATVDSRRLAIMRVQSRYASATTRRAKPALIYKNTSNLRAVQTAAQAHEAGGVPVRYLRIEVGNAITISNSRSSSNYEGATIATLTRQGPRCIVASLFGRLGTGPLSGTIFKACL